jgi:hypothetical protein
MEAAVSDFGPGIIDHFLSSDRGGLFRGDDRRTVLHSLVHDTLSSTPDPAAGRGLPNVLKAARSMGAFLSLRTGEFWIAQNFSDPAAPLLLNDIHESRLGKISGTHWQFLWPMGL